jgi:hypothetical protein
VTAFGACDEQGVPAGEGRWQLGRETQQGRALGVGWSIQYVRCLADLADLPGYQQGGALRECTCFLPVVRDEQNSCIQVVQRGSKIGKQIGPGGGVEPRERFVEQQHPRRDSESARDGYALRFAAGQRACVAFREVRNAQGFQPWQRPASRFGTPHTPQSQPSCRIVEHSRALQHGTLQHRGDCAT